MEGVLSPSGVAFVVPSLWVVTGFALATGLHFVLVGLFRRQDEMYLAFGVTSLMLSMQAGLLALSLRAISPDDVIWYYRNRTTVTVLLFPVLAWFVALYTGHSRPRWWLIGTGVVFGTWAIANIVSSAPLPFAETRVVVVRLPWGETISQVRGPSLSWAPLVFGCAYALITWALWCCVILYQRSERVAALSLGGFLLVLFAIGIYRYLIDLQQVEGFYVGDFGWVLLVLIMSLRLALVLRDRSIATEATVVQLRAEIDKRHDAEARLQHLAYHDFLTELPNRVALAEKLRETFAADHDSSRYGALLLLDLDHFKIINDALGHSVGDDLLRLVASRLQQQVHHGDVAVRMGGDEFAMLLTNLPQDEQRAAAETQRAVDRVTSAITAPFFLGDRELHVGVSIGVCLFRGDQVHDVEIFKKSDMALYRAKAQGRNLARFFTPRMQVEADERLEMEKDIRRALANDELCLHFQPEVDRTGRVMGVEALLRWRRQGTDEVLPERLIPMAEETGLIHAIGEWVLSKACMHINAWHMAALPMPDRLSINVSAWQIARAGFAEQVLRTLARHGTDPKCMLLEITESAILYDPDAAIGNVKTLNGAGIQFSIDDFGSGYSSLSHLQCLPVHQLKIDRQFVHEIKAAHKPGLVDSIVAIGRQRGLCVIAEGVETELQRATLESMRCDGFQGFLISPPLPENQFIEWLLRQESPVAVDR